MTRNQPPSGGCVLKPRCGITHTQATGPAAFGRLCVETCCAVALSLTDVSQPPSGGCVLKPSVRCANLPNRTQPPSGGCVLKLSVVPLGRRAAVPAAFGRLCVETFRR